MNPKIANYVKAALAGLLAANGVLQLVPAPLVNEVLAFLGILWQAVLPSVTAPVQPPQ